MFFPPHVARWEAHSFFIRDNENDLGPAFRKFEDPLCHSDLGCMRGVAVISSTVGEGSLICTQSQSQTLKFLFSWPQVCAWNNAKTKTHVEAIMLQRATKIKQSAVPAPTHSRRKGPRKVHPPINRLDDLDMHECQPVNHTLAAAVKPPCFFPLPYGPTTSSPPPQIISSRSSSLLPPGTPHGPQGQLTLSGGAYFIMSFRCGGRAIPRRRK